MSARAAAALTTSRSTFGVIPSPQIRPVLIARKIAPCVMPAAVVHASIVALTQVGHRNGADVPTFADEIRNDPVLVALLERFEPESQQFTTAQAAADQHGEHGMIASFTNGHEVALSEQTTALIGSEPVAQPRAQAANAFHAPNAGGEFGTEEARISRLIRDTPDGSQPQIDRCGRVVTLLQVNAVAQNHGQLNARRGSEQYHATNSPIAWSYVRCPLGDVRLLSTAVLACSRSGSASTRFGGFFLRDFGFGIGDGLLYRRRQLCRVR